MVLRMGALAFQIKWVLYILPNYKAYRFLKGGLWVLFTDGNWVKTHWLKDQEGYMKHPQDGGSFHKSLKYIVKIESYSHGGLYL